MTVKQLIEKLKQFPQDSLVCLEQLGDNPGVLCADADIGYGEDGTEVMLIADDLAED